MSEGGKPISVFGRTVQKHAQRAKEKLLHNLGRTDKTIDNVFEEYNVRYKKQESQAARLHKETKNYAQCLRALQAASRGLFDTIQESYENDWPNKDQLAHNALTSEALWTDYNNKFNEQVAGPVGMYHGQFTEMRKKVDKRGRKLIDFDSCRHAYDGLRNNPKKQDELKIARAKEQLEEAAQQYTQLNIELYDEVPNLYDSRVPFLVSLLKAMYNAEKLFHNDISNVHANLYEQLIPLAEESRKGTFKLKRIHLQDDSDSTSTFNTLKRNVQPPAAHDPNYEELSFNKRSSQIINGHGNDEPPTKEDEINMCSEEEKFDHIEIPEKDANTTTPVPDEDNMYSIPPGASTANLPMGVLYKVRATYKYNAEDVDELNFEKGEVIDVIPFDNDEEREEGWLIGIKESSGEKGLFPANFTRPI